ncbi:MAG TPA: AAA family ATPase, partial [Ktedonobacterales bacterium]
MRVATTPANPITLPHRQGAVLITSVELTNIKSYRHALIHLRAGTTAIRGENGAGKSTLVEAIGWALFDALPYSQAQFVREGEKWGQVAVTFRSAEDDREYQAVRRAGSGAAWYIYDPELEHRPAEQRTDVLDFLRRHLRIEGEIALDALFNDALGVPQGALTADFLLTAAHRKKKFDALLQVEDFGKAAEKLRDTRGYLRDELALQDSEIARLERETGPLEGWRAELGAWRERERALGAHLAAAQRQHDETAARRDALQAEEREVKRLEGERELARVTWQGAQRAADSARAQAAEAEEAERIRAAAQSDYETYQRTESELAEARRSAQVRDHRLKQRNDLANRHAAAERDVANAQARLDQALAADRRVAELAPRVAEQQRLRERQQTLASELARLDDARKTLGSREAEVNRLASAITAGERAIAAIERVRPEAALLDERRGQVEALQRAQATREERARRLTQLDAELRKASTQRANKAEQVAKAAANLANTEKRRELAEGLPTLEAGERERRGQADRLRATLAQHRESRAQSAGGNCPFLREPCLNIRQRGQSSLETYFDGLIARDEAALAALDEALAALVPDLDRARKAAETYARLEEYRERHTTSAQELAALDEQQAAAERERDDLTASLAALGGGDELRAAEALLARSLDADKQLGQLDVQQQTLVRDRKQLTAAEAERQGANELVAGLAAAPDELRAAKRELAALGDPQADAARAEGIARERPAIEADLARHMAAREAAASRVAEADAALVPFAGLDSAIAALEAAQHAARPGHQRYLQHVQTARKLPERQAALAEAEAQAAETAAAHERAATTHQRALGAFDAVALLATIEEANRLHAEVSRAAEELKHLQEAIAARETEIAHAAALLGELDAARAERETRAELGRMLEQFRDIIKEAGPFVMQQLLKAISREANRIFGEVLGDRSAQLAWEDDYEVVLHRDGQQRSFAQLSG